MPFDPRTGQYIDNGTPQNPYAAKRQAKRFRHKTLGFMPATLLFIILNTIVFLVSELFLSNSMFYALALSNYSLQDGEWFTLITSMFMHSSFSHIFNNMISLAFVGAQLEPRIGSARLCAIYLLSGIAGGFTFYIINQLTGDNSLVVGASGAIFGLFGAYGYLIFKNHMLHGRGDGSPVTEIQVALFAFFIFENVVYGFSDASVANSCHLGGLIIGTLLAMFLIQDKEI